jgi:hypothetical protein
METLKECKMINLWIDEQRRQYLKRKRKNWALLVILMFLAGVLLGHALSGCMIRSDILYDEGEQVAPRFPIK